MQPIQQRVERLTFHYIANRLRKKTAPSNVFSTLSYYKLFRFSKPVCRVIFREQIIRCGDWNHVKLSCPTLSLILNYCFSSEPFLITVV
jgi:hypothetical protein